jgi:hypothetical protein
VKLLQVVRIAVELRRSTHTPSRITRHLDGSDFNDLSVA